MTFRRQFAGGATGQTLTAPITSITTTAQISDNAGWPSGSVGPFAVVFDRGTNTEEKVLCSGQAGSILTMSTRGYDGTAANAHAAGATAELCITAIDLDEANAHTSSASGVHFITGSVVGTTDTQTLSNKILTQPVIVDHSNANHDHTTVAQGGLLGINVATAAVSYAPGGVSVAHGAPFTPRFINVMLPQSTTWLDFKVTAITSTNVSFFLYVPGGAEAGTSSGTVTILSVA